LDIHDDEFSFDASAVVLHLGHSQVALKVHEELLNIGASYLVTFKLLRLFSPGKLELGNIILESI